MGQNFSFRFLNDPQIIYFWEACDLRVCIIQVQIGTTAEFAAIKLAKIYLPYIKETLQGV